MATKTTIRYGRREDGTLRVLTKHGDVLSDGDGWTLVTNILRHHTPKSSGYFTIGYSVLGGGDVLGPRRFTIGVSQIGKQWEVI